MINQSTFLYAKKELLTKQKAGFLEIEGIVYDMRPEPDRKTVHRSQHWFGQLAKPFVGIYSNRGGNHVSHKQ